MKLIQMTMMASAHRSCRKVFMGENNRRSTGRLFFIVATLIVLALGLAACGGGSGGGSVSSTVPSGVKATPGNGQNIISWNSVAGANFYSIYWNTTGNVGTTDAAIIGLTTSPYTHTGLIKGTTYYYRVSATVAGEEKELSVEVAATPPVAPGTPTGLYVSSTGDKQVTIRWTADANVDSYTVFWNNTGGVSLSDPAITGLTTPLYKHSGIPNGNTYYYRVSAKNAGGESSLSGEVYAMPPNYINRGNGTVYDTSTLLTWEKCSGASPYVFENCPPPGGGTFQYCTGDNSSCDDGTILTSGPAYDACDSLNTTYAGGYAGRTNWRVPTRTELHSLIDGAGTYTNPIIAQSMFPNTNPAEYWSSTSEGTVAAYTVSFEFGNYPIHSKSYYYHLRCVSPWTIF